MKWLKIVGASAGVFLLVGVPLFFLAMIVYDLATFKLPKLKHGERTWMFFAYQIQKKKLEHPLSVDFYGEPKMCITREQTRDVFRSHGAAVEARDREAPAKPRDFFFWDRALQRYAVVVEYDQTRDGAFMCVGWFRDDDRYNANVAWLAGIWMATVIVLGLRLRVALVGRPDADRWLRPWKAYLDRRSAKTDPVSARKWKYAKVLIVPVLAAIWLYCGLTVYRSVGDYRCAVARQRVYKALEQFHLRFGEHPPLSDFMKNYAKYRARDQARCLESMAGVCAKNQDQAKCLAACATLPATLEPAACPDGGEWYLANDHRHVYCTRHPE